MRIFFFNRYFWPDLSATSQLLTDLAIELAARGHTVSVVTSRQRYDQASARLPAREHHQGVSIFRVRTTTFGRSNLPARALDYLSFYLSAALLVLRHVRPGDVVIAMTDPPLLGAVLQPFIQIRRALLVNWLQDVYPEVAVGLGVLGARSPFTLLLKALRNRSLQRARCNVVIGDRMREFVGLRAGGADVRVIHNWAPPLGHTARPATDNPYRRQLGLEGKTVFVYSGNLGRVHRFEALLTAGEQLKNRSDLLFLLIGSGAQFDFIQRAVVARNLGNWTFLPYQSRQKLAESLGAADVHLVSLDQTMEGLIVPSKVYGVLAAGRPCLFIGDPQGEVAELLRAHGCGLSVSSDDPKGLAQTIEYMTADPDLRRKLGANARLAFERHYTLEHATTRWVEMLETLDR